MARTLITNISTAPLTLPPPYLFPLDAGKSVVVGDPLATVAGYLSGLSPNLFRLTADVDTDVPTIATDDVLVKTVILTAAQMLALKATPVVLVAGAGAGNVLVPLGCELYLLYGGTAYVANAAEQLVVSRVGGAGLLIGGSQAFLQATASAANHMVPDNAAQTGVTDSKTLSDNVGLQIANVGALELTTGNSPIKAVLSYRVDAPGW